MIDEECVDALSVWRNRPPLDRASSTHTHTHTHTNGQLLSIFSSVRNMEITKYSKRWNLLSCTLIWLILIHPSLGFMIDK